MSGGRILEGVVVGLIVAAIGAGAVWAWRRYGAQLYSSTPGQVTDTAAGRTSYWGPPT